MKKIKLNATGYDWGNGTIISKEQAEMIIADLQAQLDAPEPVEFWEGQLVEVSGAKDAGKFIAVFDSYNMDRIGYYRARGGKEIAATSWPHCRPLQDPLIDQYKPLADGEDVPQLVVDRIRVKIRSGYVVNTTAASFNVSRKAGMYPDAIGWMPADGWGTK